MEWSLSKVRFDTLNELHRNALRVLLKYLYDRGHLGLFFLKFLELLIQILGREQYVALANELANSVYYIEAEPAGQENVPDAHEPLQSGHRCLESHDLAEAKQLASELSLDDYMVVQLGIELLQNFLHQLAAAVNALQL